MSKLLTRYSLIAGLKSSSRFADEYLSIIRESKHRSLRKSGMEDGTGKGNDEGGRKIAFGIVACGVGFLLLAGSVPGRKPCLDLRDQRD